MFLKNKKRWILLAIIVLLIVFRLFLPRIVKHEVNKVLANMEGYTGHVEDVDINLYRGAYAINHIVIEETSEDKENIPFFKAGKIDFSVEWAALFDGSIVGEVIVNNADLNFYKKASGEVETGEENDWVQTVKDLMPLKINRLELQNSRVHYIDKYASPNVDIYFKKLYGFVTNLSNSTNSTKTLPSHMEVRSTSIGGGYFKLSGDINALKEIPDFDLNIQFEKVDLTSLNDFIKAYGKFDVEQGNFNFYSEILLINEKLTGYIKPLVQNLEVLDWQAENRSLLGTIYEAVVGITAEVFENQGTDQIGSRVPISGTLEKTEASVWPAIFSLLRNAFIRPLQHRVDQSLKLQGGVSLSGEELTKEEQKQFEKNQRQKEKEEKKKQKEKDGGGFLGL